jgi:hypothetical protein
MVLFRKFVLFIAIFSIYMSVAYAASFDASAVPVDDEIIIDEFATFRLDIKNNLEQKDEYRIYTLDFPTWDVRTEPIANPITLEVGAGKEGSIELVVDPLKIREIGIYEVNVNVRSKLTNRVVSVPLKVTILSTESLIQGYVPTVVTGVSIPEKIDPREPVPITISLNNQNIIDYPDLVIKLESNLIKDAVNTQLGPKEEKTLQVTADIDPLTPPQKDILAVALFKGNRSIINPIVRNIRIIEYTSQELVSEEKRFLLTRSHYNLVSNNKDYEGVFKIETTLLASIFSSTKPKSSTIEEDGKRYFVFDVEPGDNQVQVTVTRNFIPSFVVIALLIILVVSYYMLRYNKRSQQYSQERRRNF